MPRKGVLLPTTPPGSYREYVAIKRRPKGKVLAWSIEDTSGCEVRIVASGEIPIVPGEPPGCHDVLLSKLIKYIEEWDRERIIAWNIWNVTQGVLARQAQSMREEGRTTG